MIKRIRNFIKRKLQSTKVDRQLPMEYVHTFPCGTKIYTYNKEDWGKISSRYWRNFQEYAKYVHTFYLTKNEWISAINNCKKLCIEAVKMKNNEEQIMQIHNSLQWFELKMDGTKTAEESELEFLFCMYFVLEDEKEMGFNPKHNETKIQLLNDNLEMRDFFLDIVKQYSKDILTKSREDTLRSLITMERTNKATTGTSTLMNLAQTLMNTKL